MYKKRERMIISDLLRRSFLQLPKMSLLRGLHRLSFFSKIYSAGQPLIVEDIFLKRFPSVNFFSLKKSQIHTTQPREDLMEFFDDKDNWSKKEIKVGRSWKVEELRIKSNSDLHKLWYVLLKEKNMLLTMEHEYHKQGRGLPNPERLDKVEESMENLETIVRERNRAYFELETGDTGERPSGFSTNCFGLEYEYKMKEFLLEKKFNKKYWAYQKLHNFTKDHLYVRDFLSRLDEKRQKIAAYKKKRRHSFVCKLMNAFPHLDEEALKEKFPDIDIEAVKRDIRSRAYKDVY